MKILIIILIVLFVIDIIGTYLYLKWIEKQNKLLAPKYTVNTVQVEDFYWSYVIAPSIPLKDKEGYLEWVLNKGANEMGAKLAKLGFIKTEVIKYDDGTEKVVLKLKAIRP